MQKIIFGIIGEIAAGKTTVAQYLAQTYNAPTFRFSNMLRDVADRLYLEQNRANLQKLSTVLRQNFSEDIMSTVMVKDIENSDAQIVVIEGIRRPTDISYIDQMDGFVLVAINTDARTRYDRITSRTENTDDGKKTWEEFQKESQQESESQVLELMKHAPHQIDNNGSQEELCRQIDDLIAKLNA